MNASEMFRIVGVRTNGERDILARQETRDTAERVVRLIQGASPYKELRIEGGPCGETASDSRG
jgi:hypothetical protein